MRIILRSIKTNIEDDSALSRCGVYVSPLKRHINSGLGT